MSQVDAVDDVMSDYITGLRDESRCDIQVQARIIAGAQMVLTRRSSIVGVIYKHREKSKALRNY